MENPAPDVHVGSVSVAVDTHQKKTKRREKKLRNEPSSVISDSLPASLQVVDFAEARATEMTNLLNAVKKKEVGKRTFQKLPRHMRRRAMSHNLKRLPRRAREKAAMEMENSKSDKKPCRKKRRHPRMLEKEYSSRQRDKAWLETHIWHAKRMKMINKWSYRLAEHCSSKGVRATYRYLRNGCLVSDISYYSCIEVAGTEESMRLHLGKFFDAKTGLTPLAKTFLSGTREGEAVMYHCGGYPDKPVGPVLFLWKPLAITSDTAVDIQLDVISYEKDVTEKSERKLWIWVHPSIYDEVLQTLQDGVSDQKVSVTSLRDELLRFRLLGPLAHQLLMKSLHPATPASTETMKEDENDEIKFLRSSCKWEEILETSSERKWWMTDDEYACQTELFQSYEPVLSASLTPGDFISGTALGLTVIDPRIFLPQKRSSLVSPLAQKLPKHPRLHLSEIIGEESVEDEDLAMIEDSPFAFPEPQAYDEKWVDVDEEEMFSEPDDSVVHDMVDGQSQGDQTTVPNALPSQISCSPLWRKSVRQSVSCSKIQDCVINEIRSKFLLKPSELKLGDESSRIPIVIIEKTFQRPSSCSSSLSLPHITGCDLVLPSCWGMAFWMTLVYNGGRACGMKELRSASLESLLPIFPADFPDALSGTEAANEERKALESKYHRYPPDKRPNFGKISIKTPFHASWVDLVNKWERQVANDNQEEEEEEVNAKKIKLEKADTKAISLKNESFYVLRDKKALKLLGAFMAIVLRAPAKITEADFYDLLVKEGIDSIIENHSNAIVTVSLQTAVGGSMPPHSTISLPTASDLCTFMSNQSYPGPLEVIAPRGLTITGGTDEGLQIGISQLTRKDIKEERRKQKKGHKFKASSNTASLFQMREVVPSRETIGFIGTTAGYRHSSSHYAAIGHCALRGLLEAIKIACISYSRQLVVLTRGHSRQYRYALLALVN